jgi:hypothetical protein
LRIVGPIENLIFLGSKKGDKENYTTIKHKIISCPRNHIDEKFGQGKNGYNLNKISTKLKVTS